MINKEEAYFIKMEDIYKRTEIIMSEVLTIIEEYETGELIYGDYTLQMKNYEPRIRDLYFKAQDLEYPQDKYYLSDFFFQDMMAFAHNTVFFFSHSTTKKLSEDQIKTLVSRAINSYKVNQRDLKNELEKVNGNVR